MLKTTFSASSVEFDIDAFSKKYGINPSDAWHRGDASRRGQASLTESGFSVCIADSEDYALHFSQIGDFIRECKPMIVELARLGVPSWIDCGLTVGGNQHFTRTVRFPRDLMEELVKLKVQLVVSAYPSADEYVVVADKITMISSGRASAADLSRSAANARMNPPETFELKNIRLRRPVVADAEAIFEYASDPAVVRYMDWPICSDLNGILQRLQNRATQWDSGLEFNWVITLLKEDRVIGGISCFISEESAEIGFLLNRRHWGMGLAIEAAGAVVAWAFSVPSIKKIWATCDTENLASVHALEKLGFAREAILPRSLVRPNISNEARDSYRYVLRRATA